MCRRRAPTVSIIFCYLQNLRMIISTHYLVSARPLIYNDLARKMSLPAKLAVLEKLNNKSQTIQVQNATKVNITYPEKMTDVQIRQKIEKLGYDPWLLEAIQPKGGLRPVNERYIETGCGYEACITVSKSRHASKNSG